jgi:VanZ family protein
MAMIFEASTNLGSSEHTSRIIEPLVRWLMPNISKEALDGIHYCIRKAAHFSDYSVLAILIWRALRSEPKLIAGRGLARQVVLVLLLAVLYASSDEFHQSFYSVREARVTDVLIDTLGASGGAALFLGFLWWRKKI